MGLFNFFKKKPKTPEDSLRETIRSAFKDSVKLALDRKTGDAIIDGMVLQGAIDNLYQKLKNDDALYALTVLQGTDLQKVIEEEYLIIKRKYLK